MKVELRAKGTSGKARFVLASLLVSFVAAVTVSSSAQATIQYCGTYETQSGTMNADYNSTTGRCEIQFGSYSHNSTDIYSNVRLPKWVTELDVTMAGGGASGAADMSIPIGGAGGGGGAVLRAGITIPAGTALTVGVGGMAIPDIYTYGYVGQNGFDSRISYVSSGTTYTLVAGGGRAPTSGSVSSGGSGGVVSGNLAGNVGQDWSFNGKNYGDTSPVTGASITGFSERLGSAGGGAGYGDDPGWRSPGYGAGGGGVDVNYNDQPACNADWSAPISSGACEGAAGVVRIQYEALNYYPVSWDQTPQLNVEGVVGTPIEMMHYYFSGAQFLGGADATETYQWFRCTGTASSGTSPAANCSAIAGATSIAYTPTVSDLNYKLQGRIIVTNSGQFLPSNTGHSTTITGYTETQVVVNVPGSPTLTGYVIQSPTKVSFTISPGTNWGESITYGIKDFGTNFEQAGTLSGSKLSIIGLTPGSTYTVKISQRNAAGVAYSSNAVTFTMPPLVTMTQQGTLTGDFRVGQTLTYNPSTFVGGGTVTRTATWYHCVAASVATPYTQISYETTVANWTNGCTIYSSQPSTTSLLLTAANPATATKRIVIIETATDGFTTTYTRIVSDPINRSPAGATDLVAASNAAAQATLTFTLPAEGESPISSFGYDYATGPGFASFTSIVTTNISSTVSNGVVTLTLSNVPTANQLKFRVYSYNGGGRSTASNVSLAVTIQSAASLTGTPTLTGTAAVGSTLTANTSGLTMGGSPTSTLIHSWWACDSSTVASAALMTGCTQISGATSSSYQVTVDASEKYVVYRATATNTTGGSVQNFAYVKSAATVLIPGVPSGVTSLTVSAISQTSGTVGYVLPTQVGAGPVNGIEYRVASAPSYNFPISWTAAANFGGSFELSNLAANTTYKVQVRAGNSVGFGAGVESNAFTTLGAPALSQSPTVSGTVYVGQALTATEPAGMVRGNPTPTVTSRSWYRCPAPVAAGASLSACDAISGTNSTSYTLTSADTSFFVAFAALASNSVGSVYASSGTTQIVAAVPSAPSILSAALAGQGAVNLTVQLAAANNSLISNIEYEINASGTWVSTAGVNTTFAINGLTNGQASSIRIRSVNAVGNSLPSATFSVTPLATPGVPTATRSDAAIAVSWPAISGASEYSILISTNANTGFVAVAGDCGSLQARSCVISGLTNGQDYYLKLVATNNFGDSSPSVASSAIRPLSQLTTLSSLQIKTRSNSTSNQISTTFTNNFDSSARNYSVTVNSSTLFVTLTPTQSVPGQLIKVNGTTVTSGSVSANIALSYGANTISVEVQSAEHVADSSSTATGSYTVSVIRSEPNLAAFTALSNETASSSPVPASFASVGVTGVTSSNIAAVNSAIAGLPAASVDTVAELQAVVNAYVSILSQASGGSPSQPPTAADFAAIGASAAADFSVGQVSFLNAIIQAQNSSAIASVENVKLIVDAVANLYEVASGGQASLSVAQLTAMGIQGVTAENLPQILVALAATADNGSGVDTLAEVQAIVNSVKAAAVTTLAASTNSQAAPTLQAYLQAGITGVSTTSAPAIGGFLSGLSSTAKDSTAEIQTVVDSFKFLISSAKGGSSLEALSLASSLGISDAAAGPTAATYAALGVTAAAALDSSALALLNSTLRNLDSAQIDSPAELSSLASAVDTVINSTSNASLADFQKLGLTGVTSANLSTIKALITSASSTNKDSFIEIQKLIDNSLIAAATTAFANATSSAAAMPTVQDFKSLGIAGVTNGNIDSISAAIRAAAAAANPPGSWAATSLAIQNLVDNLAATQVGVLSNYSGTGTAPQVSDYTSIGVVGIQPERLSVINQIVAQLPSNATDTSTEIQVVVDAYSAVVLAASTGKASAITLAQLQALGLSGVSSANFAAVASAISAAGSVNVDSLQELQSVVTSAISAITASVNVITAFIASPTASPSLASFKAAGLVGVTAANKAQIEAALLDANPAPSTAAELQLIVNSVTAASIDLLTTGSVRGEQIRIADFAQAGVEGVTPANLNAILSIMASKAASDIDSTNELQSVVDSFNIITAAAQGGTNASPSAAKPTPRDFAALGLELGVIATDPEAFEFLIATLAKLPLSVAANPGALQARIDIVNDVIRVASRKEPLAPLDAQALNQIGLTGITVANVAAVLAEISNGVAGIAGLPILEEVAQRYSVAPTAVNNTAPEPPAPPVTTPPTTAPNPTASPSASPVSPVKPVVPTPALPKPSVLAFGAGSTTLDAGAKKVLISQVAKIVKAKAKSVVITVTVSLPRNSSAAWQRQVLATANKRAAVVSTLVKSELKKLKSPAKTVVKIVRTPSPNVRTVSVAAKR